MTKNKGHFEAFAPHTLLKHAVYDCYVERWSRILLSRHDTVRIVDACAGEGGDVEGNPGSPLIALKNGLSAASQLTAASGVTKRVELIAIEKTRAKFRVLREKIGSAPNVQVFHGTLADKVDELSRDSAAVPHLYFRFFVDLVAGGRCLHSPPTDSASPPKCHPERRRWT